MLNSVFLFQSAWHNASNQLCFGNGQNVVPTIHIRDLGGYVIDITVKCLNFRTLVGFQAYLNRYTC